MTEAELQRRIQIAFSKLGARLFRNNVGSAWMGATEIIRGPCSRTLQSGDVIVRRGRPVTFGLGQGSSDLVGWIPVKITPDMVGRTVAIFGACEVKTPEGKLSAEQISWTRVVTTAGGIALVLRSEEGISEKIHAHLSSTGFQGTITNCT